MFIPRYLGREDLPSPTLEDSTSSLLISEEPDPESPSFEHIPIKSRSEDRVRY